MDRLLTRKELAEHWKVTEVSIDKWRKEGVLAACKGVPVVRFSEQYITELEGTKLEKFSPLEKKRLERELEEWKSRALKAEGAIAQASSIMVGALYSKSKEMKN